MRPYCRKTTVVCALFTFLVSVNIVCQGQTPDTEVSDPSVSGVSVKLSPISSTIGVGANRQLNATVSGSTNHGVTWTVNGIANGNATYGTVDPTTQLYFAPASVPNLSSFKIVATSKADKTKSATATVSVVPADPLGTVNNVKTITCPGGGLSGATCQQMAIACEGVSNWNAYVKINRPSGTSKGVVMYGIGTGGSGLYDTEFTYGQTAVQNVLDAGFTTVQVSFGAPFTTNAPNGWLTGPGGVRRLACRYATLAQWVDTHVLTSSTQPLCATGNSGGSSTIAYALSNYGLDKIFSMVEITSGPPMSRLDYGCLCQHGSASTTCGQGDLSYCYGTGNAAIVDPAYAQPICTNAVNGHPSPIAGALFLSDSIDGPGATTAFPKTYVNVLYGGLDNSAAVPLSLQWYDQVSTSKSQSCVADAPHPMANAKDAANQIANDITTLCRLQP
jgi:hypothetical protein